MLKKPTYIGVENIMSGFESLNPDAMYIYSVWLGVDDIGFQCTDTNPSNQKDALEKYLEPLSKSGISEIMYLKFHPADTVGYISKKTPVTMVTPIQVTEFQDLKILSGETTLSRPQGMSYEAWEMMKNLRDLPATIGSIVDEKLKSVINLEEDEEPEEDQVNKYIGIIKGVTQDPTIMALIGQVINFLKPQQPVVSPGRIGMTQQQQSPFQQNVQEQTTERAAIPCNEDEMNEALNRLQYHCNLGDCLRRLANMADANPAGFQQLLLMLPQ